MQSTYSMLHSYHPGQLDEIIHYNYCNTGDDQGQFLNDLIQVLTF